MKNHLKLIPLCLTLAIAAVPMLKAQSAETPNPPRERGPGGPGGPNLEMLAEELGLTAEQKAKLGPILKHQMEQMRAIRQDESFTREQRMEKGRAVREEGQKAITAVLTPEQAKKFSEMRARRGGGDRPAKGEKPGDK